jgi:CBS domain containing-hemolysin-like protein
VAVHTLAFVVGFSGITAVLLLLGEQAPKILAIRKPERIILWCAVPLRGFYLVSYPLILGLSRSTSVLLRWFGVRGGSEHEGAHSEEEIRVLVGHAHVSGELSGSEQQLIEAAFEFDETVARQIMIPRGEVAYFDLLSPIALAFEVHRAARRTRYPVCEGSIDQVRGVVHLKDLVGVWSADRIDLRKLMRPPRFVPETMRIAALLSHFQTTHQHLAFVVDEYGSIAGIVTLEDVLERIVGEVQDEFDAEAPDAVPDGPGAYLVQGGASLAGLRAPLGLEWPETHADTVSGLLMEMLGRVPRVGDRVEIAGAAIEVVRADAVRAGEVRVELLGPDAPAATGEGRG